MGQHFLFLTEQIERTAEYNSLILHRILGGNGIKKGKAFIGVGFCSVKTAAPHLLNEVRGYLCVSFHDLFKAEHFIRPLAGE